MMPAQQFGKKTIAMLALTAAFGCAKAIPVYSQREPIGTIETAAGDCQQYRGIYSDGERLELSITTEKEGTVLEQLSFTRVEQDGICVREEISDWLEPSYARQIMDEYALGSMFSFYTETRMVDEMCDGTLDIMYVALDGNTGTLKRGKDFPAENDEMLEMQIDLIDDAFNIRRQIEEWRERIL